MWNEGVEVADGIGTIALAEVAMGSVRHKAIFVEVNIGISILDAEVVGVIEVAPSNKEYVHVKAHSISVNTAQHHSIRYEEDNDPLDSLLVISVVLPQVYLRLHLQQRQNALLRLQLPR